MMEIVIERIEFYNDVYEVIGGEIHIAKGNIVVHYTVYWGKNNKLYSRGKLTLSGVLDHQARRLEQELEATIRHQLKESLAE